MPRCLLDALVVGVIFPLLRGASSLLPRSACLPPCVCSRALPACASPRLLTPLSRAPLTPFSARAPQLPVREPALPRLPSLSRVTACFALCCCTLFTSSLALSRPNLASALRTGPVQDLRDVACSTVYRTVSCLCAAAALLSHSTRCHAAPPFDHHRALPCCGPVEFGRRRVLNTGMAHQENYGSWVGYF